MFQEESLVEVEASNPALLIRAENSHGELTGVQRIFLSPDTGSKPRWMKKNKFSRGVLQVWCLNLKNLTIVVAY